MQIAEEARWKPCLGFAGSPARAGVARDGVLISARVVRRSLLRPKPGFNEPVSSAATPSKIVAKREEYIENCGYEPISPDDKLPLATCIGGVPLRRIVAL